jgi:hypothetical protein
MLTASATYSTTAIDTSIIADDPDNGPERAVEACRMEHGDHRE